MSDIEEQFNKMLKMDIDSLYILAGAEISKLPERLPDGRFRIKEGVVEVKSVKFYAEIVNDFIQKNYRKLKEIICPHYNKNRENVLDLATITSMLSAYFGGTGFVFPLLALMMRRGLDKMCNL
jgi:hypothetical protein